MTFVMADYHGHRQSLTGPDDVGEWFDEQAASILPYGGSGQVIWYGPADGQAELRVDIDLDAGRAALRWLPDDSYAVELDAVQPITVQVSTDGDLTEIPASLARVSPETARRAVIAYISTGTRPTGTDWTVG